MKLFGKFLALFTLYIPVCLSAQNQMQAEYEAALATIQDGGTYRISSVVNDTKYYLNTSGYLVDDIKTAATFTLRKMEGEEYPYGFQIDGVYFTNPNLSGNNAVLNPGHLNTNTHARNTWEAQVFFLKDGKYAIRATNAYGGDDSWALTAKTFWTVNEGTAGPVAEYTFDQPFIWQLEADIDFRAEAIRIVTGWTHQLQERQGLVTDASQWSSNAKEPTGGSYEALTDGDYTTFFHSIWSSTGPNEDHYLQAELPEATQKFYIYFQKRQQNNVDRVTRLNISASNDGVNFEDITTLDNGLPTEPEVISYNNIIDLGAPYKYVRFSVADVNDFLNLSTYNGHHWFTFSEFYILPDNKLTQEVLSYVIDDFSVIDEEDMANILELDKKIAKLFESDSDIIEFADDVVKEICVANWDTNGDGELSYDEAAAVTELGEVFKNKYIISFDELKYFTGLNRIGESTFYFCQGLKSIVIPESVTNIERMAFWYCGLTSIQISESVTNIGEAAFAGCAELTSITVATSNPVYDSRNDCNAIIETSSNTLIAGCMTTEIPESVTSIGDCAFYTSYHLTSITIPEGVSSIGFRAFVQCNHLTSISLPESLTNIDEYAFEDCSRLTSITFPKGLISIGAFAFYECSSLTSINIPEGVNSIGSGVIAGCSGLTSITVASSNPVYDSRNDCNGIIETSTNTLIAAYRNTVIPKEVTHIGSSAYNRCNDLTSFIVPEDVNSIGYHAFISCTDLTSVTIPEGVTSISEGAFSDCSNMTSVTSYIKNPFNIDSSVFDNINSSCILYIPAGTKALYEQTDGWHEHFAEIVEMEEKTLTYNGPIEMGIGEQAELSIGLQTTRTDLTGYQLVMQLPEGIDLVKNTDGSYACSMPQADNGTNNSEEATHGLTVVRQSPRRYSIVCYSQESTPLPFTSTLLNMIVQADGSVTGQHLQGMVTDILFSDIDGNPLPLDTLWMDFNVVGNEIEFSVTSIGHGTVMVELPNEQFEVTDSTVVQKMPASDSNDAMLFFEAEDGYHLEKLLVNGEDFSSFDPTSETHYHQAISLVLEDDVNITAIFEPNTSVEEYVNLTIEIDGLGDVKVGDKVVSDETDSLQVIKGHHVFVEFMPEEGYHVIKVTLDDNDVTEGIQNNNFIIENDTTNMTLSVIFAEDIEDFVVDGIHYGVIKGTENVKVLPYKYEDEVRVPETVDYERIHWSVTGLSNNAFANNSWLYYVSVPRSVTEAGNDLFKRCTRLAALSWNPEQTAITQKMVNGRVKNRNMLWFVKDRALFQVPLIGNLVVNGTAEQVALVDDGSEHGFYNPQDFKALNIQYTHNYQLETTKGQTMGWEAISLPFDVDEYFSTTQDSRIYPFGLPETTPDEVEKGTRPFWLYRYDETSDAFKVATAIEANTPYIISMPNSDFYESIYMLAGNVVFRTQREVTVKASDNLNVVAGSKRAFYPCFQTPYMPDAMGINLQGEGYSEKGSIFMISGRLYDDIQPFAAYFRYVNGSSKEFFHIFEGMTDGIEDMEIPEKGHAKDGNDVYDLAGRRIQRPTRRGIYIVGGRKQVVK